MEPRTDILARRARRQRREGDLRRASLTYAQLTAMQPEVARWWALLGYALQELLRTAEARKAYRQAAYLYRQAGDEARQGAVLRLVGAIDEQDDPGVMPRHARHGGGRRVACAR